MMGGIIKLGGCLLLIGALTISTARADDADVSVSVPAGEVSAAVQTVPLRRQMLSDQVSAYGVVAINARHAQSLSLPRAGQVLAVSVNAGQLVTKGMPLVVFATSPEAALAYRQADLAVHYAQVERAREAQLLQQQLATQAQLAAAEKTLADAQANLITQQKSGTGKAIEQIVAPYDALVSAVAVMPGDHLAAGAALLQLAQAGSQQVVLGVEPGAVIRLHPGVPVQITAVFDATHKVSGRVAQVFATLNAQTQLVDVLVELPVAGWMVGTRVRGVLQLGQQMAYVVPRSAVLRDTGGAYLFQVVQGRARRVPVQAGLEQAGLVAVSGAFIANAPVVSLGNYELQDGMVVRGGGQ